MDLDDNCYMTDVKSPRVSILIPNYNNGSSSSKSGKRDFIGELLHSLHDTLVLDPTSFEVIAYDDGSTDTSLDTLRSWSHKQWPDGRPFLELIEAQHCGVLAKTANILSRRARGQILARLDGDIVCLTPQWVSRLCEVFDHSPPRLGIVGPKQLLPDGRIHALGDWILHPHGYSHVAHGLVRYAVNRSIEVDHVMGCFYCCKKEVFDELEGYDETFLRGQTIDFGLRARLKGWSCYAIPQIEYVHNHALRKVRVTEADSQGGVSRSMRTFEEKWGFDRVAPDLDKVRHRYRGTSLLWNAKWFGDPDPYHLEPTNPQAIQIETSQWVQYSQDLTFRKQADFRAAVALKVAKEIGRPTRAVLIGSQVGLIPHLLAINGLNCLGVERDEQLLTFAKCCVASQSYTETEATFMHQPDPRKLPLDDGKVDLLLLFDQLDYHPNPVGLLKEAKRVLKPGRPMVIVSRRTSDLESSPLDREHRYPWHQLVMQIQAVGGWGLLLDPAKDDPQRDMVLVVERLPDKAMDEMSEPPKTSIRPHPQSCAPVS